MQDNSAVTIALISAISSTIAALIGVWNNYLSHRTQRHVEETKVAITQTKDAMNELERNTNGIKEDLLRVTGQAEFAKGLKEGQEGKKE